MRADIWENLISLNSHLEPEPKCLEPVAAYLELNRGFDLGNDDIDLAVAVEKDVYPLPATEDREGYYGDNHFHYWASGLRDSYHLLDCAAAHGVELQSYFDLGCASGRVLRHFALQHTEVTVAGADINRRHVDWINQYLPESVLVFQNHSIPYLPFPAESFDMVSAFSVFTHIETFETNWLMELKRILRPGGLAWVTVHTDKTWEELEEGWPLYKGLRKHPKYKELSRERQMPGERLVFRWHADRSYSAIAFYSMNYIERVWSRVMRIQEVRRRFPNFQDVVVFQK